MALASRLPSAEGAVACNRTIRAGGTDLASRLARIVAVGPDLGEKPRRASKTPAALFARRQLAADPGLELRAAAQPIELDQQVVFGGQPFQHAQGDLPARTVGRQHLVGDGIARREAGRPIGGVATALPVELGLLSVAAVNHGGALGVGGSERTSVSLAPFSTQT